MTECLSCVEQVFYCEQRKRVVSLAYEDFEMPGWMSMLIGTSTFEVSHSAVGRSFERTIKGIV